MREGVPETNLFIAPPAIDPLSPKNVPLDREEADRVLDKFFVDPKRPMVCQVSRFDPWKDPLGVIDAYRIARKENPSLRWLSAAAKTTRRARCSRRVRYRAHDRHHL